LGAANKVILNTGILYGRMLLTMGISLYSTRLVLNALGSADYGIFNLVAGVIAMLAFLNTAMATSTQRYLSFHQAKEEPTILKKIFTNSLMLHVLIGIIIVIVLEIAGFFLFNGFLNIPNNRIESAKIIYHFMAGSIFFSISVVPFIASLNAHENMIWIAFVSIIEVLLKLGVALLLLNSQYDKLLLYGLLTASISLLILILHMTYCLKNYRECTLYKFWKFDKILIKELTSFAGWNLFGSLCTLGRVEGFTILLNLFFGAVINAAYGIANQVAGQLSFFSVTMLQALNPQIMKSEGADNRKRMLRLSMIASKFSFFLLAVVAIPIIFEMNSILKFWLKNVPEFTVVFCRLILFGTMINQLTIGLQSALQATGKIKFYQIVVGSLILLNLPIAYFLLKLGYPAYSALISYIIIELVACSFRIYFLKKVGGLSISEYFEKVIFREIIPILSSIFICYLITSNFSGSYRFLITTAFSSIIFISSVYFVGLCEDEKEIVNNTFLNLFTKIKTFKRVK
jgi:O-antigen/teichoic acid export membrane protein